MARLLLVLLLCFPCRAASPSSSTVSVDFSARLGPANGESSAVQQEIFVNATTPATGVLAPLKLVRYRGHEILSLPGNYARLRSLGVRDMHYILADDPAWAHRWPPNDWEAWRVHVNRTIAKAVAQGKGDVMWEPWNEPDGDWFGSFGPTKPPGNESTWLRMWEIAVKAIRAASPNATVVGPTLACTAGGGWELYCDPQRNSTMARFLTFAHARNVLPDVLAWHEWAPRGTEVPSHVAGVRAAFAEMGLAPPRICINEIITGTFNGCQTALPSATSDYWKPGAIVSWLSHIAAANGKCSRSLFAVLLRSLKVAAVLTDSQQRLEPLGRREPDVRPGRQAHLLGAEGQLPQRYARRAPGQLLRPPRV